MNGQERTKPSKLPDVAVDQEPHHMPLAWVGMNEIEIPVRITSSEEGSFLVPARAEVKVRLETADRGIHMSRLFVGLQSEMARTEINTSSLQNLTEKLLQSQKDLSKEVYLSLKFELPVLRPSLLSHNQGWRSYPVVISAYRGPQGYREYLDVLVTYSSTCPMSAALSRQINSQAFAENFKENMVNKDTIEAWLLTPQAMAATPHAQRSTARVRVEKSAESKFTMKDLIEIVESTLQTAVQSAVKREDEQEFARRNATNLMFCEDAARKVQAALKNQTDLRDFYGEFHHLESLHPHNAVSHIQKSDGGLNSFAIPTFLR
ncbi:MAG: GTP cyclohydrolase FolE2 [Bdellovibrionota bacterium]